MNLSEDELKSFLEAKYKQYHQIDFIQSDPILIPRRFANKNDIEIAGFLVATISWGKRDMIIKNGLKMMELLDNEPYQFVIQHQPKDLQKLQKFVHRTYNGIDFIYFIQALQHIYKNYGGLEDVFTQFLINSNNSMFQTLCSFNQLFFELPHAPERTKKHTANPALGSAAKRLNMFLRWMVRNDNQHVDFGLWKSISPSVLICPLDVHTGNTARKLGILSRKQNDWKAAAELTNNLIKLDPNDPVKYDYALFGLGVFEKF
jgi:uncharacterized protein (TIGR02757 family)